MISHIFFKNIEFFSTEYQILFKAETKKIGCVYKKDYIDKNITKIICKVE